MNVKLAITVELSVDDRVPQDQLESYVNALFDDSENNRRDFDVECIEKGIERVVYTSCGEVIEAPDHVIALSILHAEVTKL